MLVAVAGDKGSPGATTTAVALAAAWPGSAVVVEADPAGGDLALRLRLPSGEALPPTPTVLTLAAAARQHVDNPQLVVRHASGMSDHMGVIPGPMMAEQSAGIAGSWDPLAAALSRSAVDVIVDVGRLDTGSSAMAVAAAADVVVIVGRPTAVGGLRLRERAKALGPALSARRGRPAMIWPVVVAPSRHADDYTADLQHLLNAAGVRPVGLGHILHDAAAVARLEAGENPTARLLRTPLMRSAKNLAGLLIPLGARREVPVPEQPNGDEGPAHRLSSQAVI
jgi:hypothetical protein